LRAGKETVYICSDGLLSRQNIAAASIAKGGA